MDVCQSQQIWEGLQKTISTHIYDPQNTNPTEIDDTGWIAMKV